MKELRLVKQVKDKYSIITYMWNLKNETYKSIYKTKADLQVPRQTSWY